MNIKLSDIRQNPNRDLKFNPWNEEKIATLIASIKATDFWTNIIVRKAPDGKGYEQAYGHHRIEAARRCDIKSADFVVRDLDENKMLKMMELENQEDYRCFPLSLLESVQAVVKALAAGKIDPFYYAETGEIDAADPFKGTTKAKNGKWQAAANIEGEKTHLGTFDTREEAAQTYRAATKGRLLTHGNEDFRVAPKFSPVSIHTACCELQQVRSLYNVMSIARFLGKTSANGVQADFKVRTALDALYLLEVKAITVASIKDMNWSELGKLVTKLKSQREREILRKDKEAAALAKNAAESLRIQAENKIKEEAEEKKRKELAAEERKAKREKRNKKRLAKIQAEKDALEEAAKEREEVHEEQVEENKEEKKKIKKKADEAKKEDEYLPLRKEVDRVVHLLERKDEEEAIKALAIKTLTVEDRQRVVNAANQKGEWGHSMARLMYDYAPKSAKEDLAESAKREENKRRAEEKEKENQQ